MCVLGWWGWFGFGGGPLAGLPAGGGTFLFLQESTQRRGLLGRRWGRAFLACGSRGLGGPSRSRPPLRTPPGTLRRVGQGCDFNNRRRRYLNSSLFTIHSSLALLLPGCCVFRRWVEVWGERVLTSGGALLRTTVVSGDSVAEHFPLSTFHCPLVFLLPGCCVFRH